MAETVGSYYNDVYLRTHQERMNMSIKLAQAEYDMLQDRIEFYEKELLRYDDAVKSSRSGVAQNKVWTPSDRRGYLAEQNQINKTRATNKAALRKEAQGQLDITRFDIPAARQTMVSQMRVNEPQNTVTDKAIQNIGGKGAGTSKLQRIAIAKALLGAQENAATEAGRTDFSRSATREYIRQQYGLTSAEMTGAKSEEDLIKEYVDARAIQLDDMESPQKVGTSYYTAIQPKEKKEEQTPTERQRFIELQTKQDKGSISEDEKAELETLRNYNEYVKTQDKLTELRKTYEDRYGEDADIEDIIMRGREIYRNQFAPLTSEQRQLNRTNRIYNSLNERGRVNLAAYESVKSSDPIIQEMIAGKTEDFESGSVADFAYQIYNDKKQGRDIDAAAFALQSAGGDTELQKRILGLAIHAVEQDNGQKPGQKSILQEVQEKLTGQKGEKTDQQIDETDALIQASGEITGNPAKGARIANNLENLDFAGLDDMLGGGRRTPDDLSELEALAPMEQPDLGGRPKNKALESFKRFFGDVFAPDVQRRQFTASEQQQLQRAKAAQAAAAMRQNASMITNVRRGGFRGEQVEGGMADTGPMGGELLFTAPPSVNVGNMGREIPDVDALAEGQPQEMLGTVNQLPVGTFLTDDTVITGYTPTGQPKYNMVTPEGFIEPRPITPTQIQLLDLAYADDLALQTAGQPLPNRNTANIVLQGMTPGQAEMMETQQPAAPVLPSVGTRVGNYEYNGKPYFYEIREFDADGNPQFDFIGTTGSRKPATQGQITGDLVMEEYQKLLEK